MAVLAEDVRNSLRKGYSLKEIRELLAAAGLKLPASVLKTFLAQDLGQETSQPETRASDDKQETRVPDALTIQPDVSVEER